MAAKAWSWLDAAGVAAAASVVVPWTARFAVPCLPVIAACAAAALWAGSVAVSVDVASVDVAVVVEPPLVAAAACVFPWVFVTGVVAATAVVRAEASVDACAPALAVVTGAGTPAFAVACELPDEVAVPGSVLPWTDGPGGGESGCELAAIAAAASASGAVDPPEEGVGVGVGALPAGVDVGIAVATGVGVVEVLPTCCARMVASSVVASLSASLPLDLSPSGFDVPDFAVVVVPVVDWLFPFAAAALLLALAEADGSELELDDGPSLAASPESSFAGGGGVLLLALALLLGPLAPLLASFAGGALLAAAGGGEPSALFCAGGGGGGDADADSFGVFWLTRFPKRSFAGDELKRVDQEGAAWNAALAVASWVALSTGRTPARELGKTISKDRAIPSKF